MRINHNIAALNTYRQFNNANNAQSKSMEKLSSGLRINSAADDAAGLAISEKMRGQIRGLDMASKNAQDATSLIQTAEGGLNETHDILQRMRELSVQSANDTNTDEDRKNIQDEMDQLGKEIDRVAETTQFNTKNLLDGSMDKSTTAQGNTNSNTALKGASNAAVTTATSLTDLSDKDGNNLGIQVGDTIEVSYVQNGQTVTHTFTNDAGVTDDGTPTDASLTVADLTTTGDSSSNAKDTAITLTDDTGTVKATAASPGQSNAIHGLTITVKDSSGNVRTGASNALSSFSETQQATNVHSDGSSTFQIGANTGQNINLAIKDMGASALGVKDIKVGNQGQANVATKVIDEAIQKVSAERSKLGATQNRLEHTINNLNTSSENLTSAESRIRDVDYALAA
ncbi:flagellin [Priestia megaterium]|uniref:flagellin N-terminal helical domain-containing protein n=1 Tax=Priestia megaterium TaxID=1404 RepID=UPI00298D5F8F|nr:flagellin [Priestia megaterium]